MELIHALQLSPRASWTQLGRALALDPVTVARRWERLAEAGLAWVTCVAGTALHSEFCMVYIEIECVPGRLDDIATALSAEPHVRYVHHLTGPYGLLFVATLRTPAEMPAYLRGTVGQLSGVRAYRAEIRTVGYREPSRWRLRSLEQSQRRALEPSGAPPTTVGGARMDAVDRELYRLLHEDGRMSYTALADRAGISEPTTRRRVKRLLTHRWLRLRCEMAQSLSGWPYSAFLWASVAPQHMEATARWLTALPDVRLCCALTGERNLLLMVWLRSLGDLPQLEATITERSRNLSIVDRAACLHTVKQMGRLLDGEGRSVGHVPPNVGAFLDA
ncbi:Lrp/AsnC family transcriptional regulator [Streptomyces sp. NPDC006332]|uniref:Lrp/AsnC family transcriptional regulator n=1 Tax=Streptomyces sp. NPDC006332 TaxID=3155456 RepID=UPI0033B27B06